MWATTQAMWAMWANLRATLQKWGQTVDAVNLSPPPPADIRHVSDQDKRRRIRDTRVGQWLTQQAPNVLDVVGDVLPDDGVLGIVKNIVDRDPSISHDQRLEFEQLLISERQANEREMSSRWASDMASDSWLAKSTRPIIVLSLVSVLFLFMILDSLDIAFEVRDAWITLYEILIVTAVGGYFTLRSVFDKRPTK